jgi:hypothetical protein
MCLVRCATAATKTRWRRGKSRRPTVIFGKMVGIEASDFVGFQQPNSGVKQLCRILICLFEMIKNTKGELGRLRTIVHFEVVFPNGICTSLRSVIAHTR